MLSGGFQRVTNSMMTNTFIRDIQRNLKSVEKLQHQISTGKRLEYPSDDPISADRALDYRQMIAQYEQYSKNVGDALDTAQNVDGLMQQVEDLLLRVRDLAVRASNEAPNNQAALDALANEIDSLTTELVHQANQKFNGKYIFAGDKTNITPFTAKRSIEYITETPVLDGDTITMPASYDVAGAAYASQAITDANSIKAIFVNGQELSAAFPGASYTVNPVTDEITFNLAGGSISAGDTIELKFDKAVAVEYNGNAGTKEIEISDGTLVGVSYAGAASADATHMSLFGQYNPDDASNKTVYAFQKLFDLRDSIRKYSEHFDQGITNIEDIMRGIDHVDEIRENVTNLRAEQGARVNRLELTENRLEKLIVDTEDMRSKHEDVDMEKAISELVLQQNIYQAALGAGARIIQTTLLNFLT